jgi:hypothetical protein
MAVPPCRGPTCVWDTRGAGQTESRRSTYLGGVWFGLVDIDFNISFQSKKKKKKKKKFLK